MLFWLYIGIPSKLPLGFLRNFLFLSHVTRNRPKFSSSRDVTLNSAFHKYSRLQYPRLQLSWTSSWKTRLSDFVNKGRKWALFHFTLEHQRGGKCITDYSSCASFRFDSFLSVLPHPATGFCAISPSFPLHCQRLLIPSHVWLVSNQPYLWYFKREESTATSSKLNVENSQRKIQA